MEKQSLQDLVEIWAKNVCFSPKTMPKICVTQIKSTKAQLHYPRWPISKFQVKTPSGYGETTFIKFGWNLEEKRMFFTQKIPEICVT